MTSHKVYFIDLVSDCMCGQDGNVISKVQFISCSKSFSYFTGSFIKISAFHAYGCCLYEINDLLWDSLVFHQFPKRLSINLLKVFSQFTNSCQRFVLLLCSMWLSGQCIIWLVRRQPVHPFVVCQWHLLISLKWSNSTFSKLFILCFLSNFI